MRSNLSPRLEVEGKPKKTRAQYHEIPLYENFWVYLTERYQVAFAEKGKPTQISVVVDCFYGVEGKKDKKNQNQKPSKYKRRECRLIKLLPVSFPALPVPRNCDLLKVSL